MPLKFNPLTGELDLVNVSAGSGGVTDGDKGDITVSSSGTVWTIDNQAVTRQKLEHIQTGHFLGRHASGTGDVQEVSPTQARNILNVEDGAEVNNISDTNATDLTDGGDSSLHFHSSDRNRSNHTGTQTASTISDFDEAVDDEVASLLVAGTNITLSYDDVANTLTINSTGGSYTDEQAQDAVGGIFTDTTSIDLIYDDAGNTISAQREALTGDVTASKNSNTTTIANDAVTNAKAANMAVNTIKGRIAAGTGDPEDLTAAQVRTITETETTTQLNTRDTNNRSRANHTGTQTASTISDFNTAADARITAATGVSVQGYDADLQAIGALSASNDDIIQRKAGAWVNRTVAQYKTDLALTKSDVGLANVDNTSDATKNSATATLTNKTISGASNTLSDIPNSALSTDPLARANHTGAQAISTVTGLQAALDNKVDDTQLVGLSKITVGTTAPSSPSTGDLWVDTN